MTTPPTVGKVSGIAPYLDTIASGMDIGSRLLAILRDDPSVVHAFDSVIRDLFHRCRIELVPALTAASATKDRKFGHQRPAVINNGEDTGSDDTGSDDIESDDETASSATSD